MHSPRSGQTSSSLSLWSTAGFLAWPASLILGACLAIPPFSHAAQPTELEAGFRNPPPEARPQAWWHWINGHVSKEGIKADLLALKEAGISGVQLLDANPPGGLPAGPVRYGSKEWLDLVQYAINTAAELGLDFTLMNCPGWSTSGGPWITAEQSMKMLTWSTTSIDITSQATKISLPEPPAKADFYRDIAVFAIPPTGHRLKDWVGKALFEKSTQIKEDISGPPVIAKKDVRNLTEFSTTLRGTSTAPGEMTVELPPDTLPPGKWTFLRVGYTTTEKKNHPAQKEGTGFEVDKMDSEAVRFHFARSLDPILKGAPPNAIDGVLIDSWEAGKQNWTKDFPEEFRRLRGYDLRPWLPVLAGYVLSSEEETEAVLRDFRLTASQLVSSRYFETMQDEARMRGLRLHAEPYHGVVFNEFTSSVPVDEVMTEFWVHGARLDDGTKEIASFVHTTGKDRLSSEAFTSRSLESGSWLETPSILKPVGDRAFALGINRLVLHSVVHQPRSDLAPGLTLGQYGSHFGRLETWWPLARAWIDYLARCQWLLQQGHFVGDILFLQTDEVFKFKPRVPSLPPGYDFDGLHPSQLSNLQVDPSKRTVFLPKSGQYRAILLPETWQADMATLQELKRLALAGAKILGSPPERPAGLLEDKKKWLEEVRILWGPSTGKDSTEEPVLIQSSVDIATWLKTNGIEADIALSSPDFSPTQEEPQNRYRRWYFPTEFKEASPSRDDIRHTHRRTKEGDEIYFIASMATGPVRITAAFRDAHSRRAEVWDPVTTSISIAPIQKVQPGGAVEMNFTLAAGGSAFIIFRGQEQHGSPKVPGEESRFPSVSDMTPDGKQLVSIDGKSLNIEPSWTVTFQPVGSRSPSFQRSFPRLMNWKESDDPQVRFFAGLADYQCIFHIPESTSTLLLEKGIRARLKLGDLFDIASVTINGKPASTIWTRPYELDVTSLIVPGENTLSIKVANRWPNSLIGDEAYPLDAKFKLFSNRHGQKIPDALLAELPSWWNDPEKTASRERQAFSTWRLYTKESPLLDSGLIGPVSLSTLRPIEP